MQETWDAGLIPGSRRSPGGGNGNHSRILAWRIPWTEEPGGLQSMGSRRVGYAIKVGKSEERWQWGIRWKDFLFLSILSVDPDTAQKLKETKKNVIGSSYFSLSLFHSFISHNLQKWWEVKANDAVNLLKDCHIHKHYQTKHSSQYSQLTGKQLS